MNSKHKTAIIVIALVLIPIVLVCCAFALALGCAEFWSSGRFTLIKPWCRRKLSGVRRGVKPIRPSDPAAIRHHISSNAQPTTAMAEV